VCKVGEERGDGEKERQREAGEETDAPRKKRRVVFVSFSAQVQGTLWVVDWRVLRRLIHTDERGEPRQLWTAVSICLDAGWGREDLVAKKRSVQGSVVASKVIFFRGSRRMN